MNLTLHGFFRSGTSHRLRIALNLKGLFYKQIALDLRKEQHSSAQYIALNPQKLVPTLQADDLVLTQSPAILEWLEERFPEPALLPPSPQARAQVRALAALIGCDVHPINNRRILETLRLQFGADEAAIHAWCATWICAGFDAYSALVQRNAQGGPYSYGNMLTLADVYLIPQIESARRFQVDMRRWPCLLGIDKACSQLPAFQKAAPAMQPDAV